MTVNPLALLKLAHKISNRNWPWSQTSMPLLELIMVPHGCCARPLAQKEETETANKKQALIQFTRLEALRFGKNLSDAFANASVKFVLDKPMAKFPRARSYCPPGPRNRFRLGVPGSLSSQTVAYL